MVNSYVHVEPKTALTQVPQITAQEAQRRFQQGEFLRRNHHNISPWMYTPAQIKARNHALMLMHWDLAPPRANPIDTLLAESPTIKRTTYVDGKWVEDIHGVGYAP